jgi:ATP-dependent Clp protease protease subunit
VRVNSPGGEATEGIAIANLLRAHAAKIHVTVYGLAASAASYISTAGDSVSMAPGSMLMVHCAWNVARGNADDMRAEAAVLDKLDESIASLYALKAAAPSSTGST